MNATARRTRTRSLRVAAAVLTAAAALTLSACSGSDASGTKTTGKADTSAGASDTSAGGSLPGSGSNEQGGSDKQGGSNEQGGSTAKGGSGAKADGAAGGNASEKSTAQSGNKAGSSSNSGGASASKRCHTSELRGSFATGEDAAPDENADGATTTSIVLTNKGSRTCVIGGFPGVDLTSENGGERWSLARSSAKFSSITLNPGDSTDFKLNVLMTKDDENFYQPAHVEVTPPNETSSLNLNWPWGTLVKQDGATHPGTFVNPIG
ncbi:DUF4232 domain-containing protein [Streptomyces sp. NPDC050610]|uniref:DUF4232 domain-containing protein n=1 Tax=Streptomyces sp. NPDC050610 TaxID=3157097 RepID=UPI0034142990